MRIESGMKDIEASKSRMRRRLAERPVAEKLRLLDALRIRAITLRGTGPDKSRRTTPER